MSSSQASPKAAVQADKKADMQKKATIHYPFWFGGSASSMAACVTHPLDLGMLSRHVTSQILYLGILC